MSDNNADKSSSSAWNDEAKLAFLAFKKTKRNLPSPGDIDNPNSTKKTRTGYGAARNNNRIAYRQQIMDRNRTNLFSEHNDPFTATDNIKSSTFSENFVSMDVSELDSDKTEVACDEITKCTAQLREMVNNKDDPYLILDKMIQ